MGFHLLSGIQTKMEKSLDFGYLSVVLHLEPAFQIDGFNTCPRAGQCKAYCLANSGRMRFKEAKEARIRRTTMFVREQIKFLSLLSADIYAAQSKAEKLGLPLTVRLNGTSDVEWEDVRIDTLNGSKSLFELFPTVQFIDYTKIAERCLKSIGSSKWPKNYKLVYSWNEQAIAEDARAILESGGNVAVVFDVKKGAELPTHHTIDGVSFPVFDGDHNDLRHLDPAGHVVGLRYKYAFKPTGGKAIKAKKGFIILN